MNTKRYYIGKTLIEITASDLLQKCMNLFCISEQEDRENDGCFLKYEIVQEESVKRIAELFEISYIKNAKEISFELLNIKYIYLEKEQVYMAINSFCFGIIDIVNKNIKWHVYLKHFSPRSLFHIMILDPYSLVCPQINEIIVHGSLMSVGQKSLLFLGGSGNGKSTITHRLSKYMSYEKMCDDTFVISVNKDKLVTYPIDTGCGYDYDVAKDYVNTGDYFELYQAKSKVYILKKNIQFSEGLCPHLIFFLERVICKTDNATTLIEALSSKEILKFIINNQTNIGSPLLLKKMEMYKIISESLQGASISFINDCDVNAIDIFIKNN